MNGSEETATNKEEEKQAIHHAREHERSCIKINLHPIVYDRREGKNSSRSGTNSQRMRQDASPTRQYPNMPSLLMNLKQKSAFNKTSLTPRNLFRKLSK